ncbi:hypothetical protein SBA2_450032 [Acidobacteriia bacterium SbA2]|nr:hypothetical protein SBA2_450032 [Acidobacteriia bacterium SbA2]
MRPLRALRLGVKPGIFIGEAERMFLEETNRVISQKERS